VRAHSDRGTLNAGKTAIEGTPARQEDWTLNQTGNWAGYDVAENGQAVLNQTRTNNKANEILSTTEAESQTQWVTPVYDARGNMTTVPKPDSPASAFTCTWDAWNRLVEVKYGEATLARYAYDGTARRGASHAGMAQVGDAENRLIGKPGSRLFSGTFLLVTHAIETAG